STADAPDSILLRLQQGMLRLQPPASQLLASSAPAALPEETAARSLQSPFLARPLPGDFRPQAAYHQHTKPDARRKAGPYSIRRTPRQNPWKQAAKPCFPAEPQKLLSGKAPN